VDPAALHRGAGHHGADGLPEAEVGVGDDQLHPAQPTGLERPEERGPERTVFGVADREAEDLAAAIPAHPSGDYHGLGDHPAVDPGLAVGGIHEHIREALAGQRAVPERADFAV
jgi:hypothetical protein